MNITIYYYYVQGDSHNMLLKYLLDTKIWCFLLANTMFYCCYSFTYLIVDNYY